MIKTFEKFIKQIYFISVEEYFNLNEMQKEYKIAWIEERELNYKEGEEE